jgi:hypothetical protein
MDFWRRHIVVSAAPRARLSCSQCQLSCRSTGTRSWPLRKPRTPPRLSGPEPRRVTSGRSDRDDPLDRARAAAIGTADAAHSEAATAARAARDALASPNPSRGDVLTGRAPATAEEVAVAVSTIQRA